MPSYAIRAFGATVAYTPPVVSVTPIISPFLTPGIAQYYVGTGGIVPVYAPNFSYQIGGQVLDTPWVATAPETSLITLIPVGSQFLLVFDAPSSSTQGLLVSGSIVTMTFVTVSNGTATGSVLLNVTQNGTTWIAMCTALSSISVTPST